MAIITKDESRILVVQENNANFIVTCNLLPLIIHGIIYNIYNIVYMYNQCYYLYYNIRLMNILSTPDNQQNTVDKLFRRRLIMSNMYEIGQWL